MFTSFWRSLMPLITQAGKGNKKNKSLFLLWEPRDPSRLENQDLSHVEVTQRSNFSSLLTIPFTVSVMYFAYAFLLYLLFLVCFFSVALFQRIISHIGFLLWGRKTVHGYKWISATNWIPFLSFHTDALCW